MIIDPPEDFKSYAFETLYGTIMLPDARCLWCLSSWSFYGCNMCCLTQTLMETAMEERKRRGME